MSGLITAIVGAGVAVATTGMSFAQANKQNKLKRNAEDKADKAMQEAKKKMDVNYLDALAVKKDPYELQSDILIAQGAQALEAGKEGDVRGAAATAGRVQGAVTDASGKIRTEMSKELQELERLQAVEEGKIRDEQVALDLAEVEGAQIAAGEAANASAQATQQGLAGLTQVASSAMAMIPLYAKNKNPITPVTDIEKKSIDIPMPKTIDEPSIIVPEGLSSTPPTVDYQQYVDWMHKNGYGYEDGSIMTSELSYDNWVSKYKRQ